MAKVADVGTPDLIPMKVRTLGRSAGTDYGPFSEPGTSVQDHVGTRSDRRPCVLVVEDEVFIRMDAAEILADASFDVLEAADAEQAIGILDAGAHADLLFTDLNMPGMNGLDLSVIVHARWPDVGLLMTSGRQDIPVEMIPDHGLFLDKPYEPKDLVRMVRRCLELRNL